MKKLLFSDTPYSLALAALEAIPALAGTAETGFDWTVYTGDLVSHDRDNQLSRLVSPVVKAIFHLLTRFICETEHI